MQYLRCRDHSNIYLFLVIQLVEVLLNFLVGVFSRNPKATHTTEGDLIHLLRGW